MAPQFKPDSSTPLSFEQYVSQMANDFVELLGDLHVMRLWPHRQTKFQYATSLKDLKSRVFRTVSFLVENEAEIDHFNGDDISQWRHLIEAQTRAESQDTPYSLVKGSKEIYFDSILNNDALTIAKMVVNNFAQKVSLMTNHVFEPQEISNHPSSRWLGNEIGMIKNELDQFVTDLKDYISKPNERCFLHCLFQPVVEQVENADESATQYAIREGLASFGVALKNAIKNGQKLEVIEATLGDHGIVLLPRLVALYEQIPEFIEFLDASLATDRPRLYSHQPFTDTIEQFYVRNYNARTLGLFDRTKAPHLVVSLENVALYDLEPNEIRSRDPFVMGRPEGNIDSGALEVNIHIRRDGNVPAKARAIAINAFESVHLSSNNGLATDLSLN